jgi:hypothetical protein
MAHTRVLTDRRPGDRSTAPGPSGIDTPTRHLAAIREVMQPLAKRYVIYNFSND